MKSAKWVTINHRTTISDEELLPYIILSKWSSLLQTLEVALATESAGKCAEARVVHVDHDVLVLAKGHIVALVEEGVLVLGLPIAPA